MLFSLRDVLRCAAATHDVNADGWVFDYIDSSLTKAAATLPRLTAYELLACMVAERKLRSHHHEDYRLLQKELEKPENSRLRAIHQGYTSLLTEFLSERHAILIPLLKRVGIFLARVRIFLARFGKPIPVADEPSAVEVLAADPEISTLHEYCK